MTQSMQHCSRPWWKRPPVWLIAAFIVGGLAYVVFKEVARPPAMPYGEFLDQLEAGNVASVTFEGTQIDGRFNRAADNGRPTGASHADHFRTRLPDFGDPSLIPELRRQRAAIDVASSAGWASLVSRLPWPLVAFLVVAMIAAVVRVVRGPKAGSGGSIPMHPAGGIIGLVSGLFASKRDSGGPPSGG